MGVLPILFEAAICLTPLRTWWLLACRALPDLAVATATRPNPNEPGPLALLPAARSPSRLHCCNRWWALTPPFHPLPAPAFAGRWRDYSLLRL